MLDMINGLYIDLHTFSIGCSYDDDQDFVRCLLLQSPGHLTEAEVSDSLNMLSAVEDETDLIELHASTAITNLLIAQQ